MAVSLSNLPPVAFPTAARARQLLLTLLIVWEDINRQFEEQLNASE
jgi:hypothetical protein